MTGVACSCKDAPSRDSFNGVGLKLCNKLQVVLVLFTTLVPIVPNEGALCTKHITSGMIP